MNIYCKKKKKETYPQIQFASISKVTFRETKAETVNSRSETFQMSSIHNHHPYKRQRERKKKSWGHKEFQLVTISLGKLYKTSFSFIYEVWSYHHHHHHHHHHALSSWNHHLVSLGDLPFLQFFTYRSLSAGRCWDRDKDIVRFCVALW